MVGLLGELSLPQVFWIQTTEAGYPLMIRQSGWAEGWFMRTTYELLRKKMFGTQLAWSILVTVFWSKATVKQLRICCWNMTGFHEVSLWLKFSMHTKIPNLYESLHSLCFNMKGEHLSLEFPRFLTWVCFCNWPNSWDNFQWIARLDFSGQFGGLESVCLLCWSHDGWWGASTRCFWTNWSRSFGGKKVGRWLEDVRRWYGVVWVWMWHGMGFGMGVGIWCYHGHGEVLEKLTPDSKRVTRIAPEFGGLTSGTWWLVKY